MPLTIFDVKGVPGARRERIEAAVIAGGKHLQAPYEGWIAADAFSGGVRLLITGAHGFQREVGFAMDDEAGVITQRWTNSGSRMPEPAPNGLRRKAL